VSLADHPLEQPRERRVGRHTGYPGVDGGDLVGSVTLEDVQEVDPERHDGTSVREVMSTELATVSPDSKATEALSLLQQRDIGRVLVTDGGELAGLLSRTDLMTVLEIARTSRSEAVTQRAVGADEATEWRT
jgi:CBS domain-containing protein